MTNIQTLASVKRALRDVYAWPGGYPLYIVMADGEALSIAAARAQREAAELLAKLQAGAAQ
jgi:hypothetical protein